MRHAFSVVEMAVVLGIMVTIMVAVWASLSHLTRSEQSTDREATRALLQARLAEMLHRDLRSSVDVSIVSDREYRINRWVLDGDRLQVRAVTWKRIDEFKISRSMPPDPLQEFNFRGLLDAESPGLTFRLEPLGDAVFHAP